METKQISERGSNPIWYIIGAALLIGLCWFGGTALYAAFQNQTVDSAQIVTTNLLEEKPYGMLIAIDPDFFPLKEMGIEYLQQGVMFSWVDIEGNCIPEDCTKMGWVGASETEIANLDCGTKIVTAFIGQRILKPNNAAATTGAKVKSNVFSVQAMTDKGCPVGKPYFSRQFIKNGLPTSPPENFNDFWGSAQCYIATRNMEMPIKCFESGYYPEGNIIWAGPEPQFASKNAWVAKASHGGIFLYPLDSIAVTEEDKQLLQQIPSNSIARGTLYSQFINIFQSGSK